VGAALAPGCVSGEGWQRVALIGREG